ncbi:phosphatase PAP2 family protein [Bradyrhizobium erythrophlei]|uniref:phosphatase PAP2 family protein n=1 Tax=Bradyrhizobium erythrophlei TaxID=1437360 RepID=UPI0035EE58B4
MTTGDNVAKHVAMASVATGSGAALGADEVRASAGDGRSAAAARSPAKRDFALAWGLAGAVLCVDLAWFPLSRLRIADPPTFLADLAIILSIVVCYLALFGLHWYLGDDTHRMARVMSRVSERSALVVHGFIFLIVLFGSVVGFTYLAASIGWPLRDAQLALIDRWLGFDWPGFLAFSNSNALWARVLVLAYDSSGPQLILLYLLLGLAGHRARLAELSLLLSLTAVATVLLFLVVPAAGAYAHYAPDARLFNHLDPKAGMWHFDILLGLRNDAAPSFAFEGSQGMVVFPSFHTMLAMLMPYAVRDVRRLFLPVAALNVLVIVSTVPEGGHHLIDVIAGIAITCAAIALVRRYSRI